jgi:histidinol dehydrogenase
MISIISNIKLSEVDQVLARPYSSNQEALNVANNIIANIKQDGDKALKQISVKIDLLQMDSFLVSTDELETAASTLTKDLINAIETAIQNITRFHTAQKQEPIVVETMNGVVCQRKSIPINSVGLYIPGGTAALFSTLLMLAIPAQIAGCQRIVLTTPPDKQGGINAVIAYCAKRLGLLEVYKIGGAQAIAALAYGTESIQKVDKIFGPGNQYVTAAKQLVQAEGIAIDMPAGPSEVLVIADDNANPDYVAADLLSQAEHGADSQVVLISNSVRLFDKVNASLTQQLMSLPRKEIAEKALANSKFVLSTTLDEAMAISNAYAPEHLIINTHNDEALSQLVSNAGSVFMGAYSPESVGDYASGTNHTLPTNGFAKAYSGVSIDSFVKKITFQKLSKTGLNTIAQTVITMAEAEGLEAHANAVKIRLRK